ncbi:chromate transporter [Chromobacterium violaceum]|uniref:chromate transporter n=1 Tax=Chromobacterium violaceum TaxID=536 RepID=UPI0021F0998A|nr:chromate transporter [Chromobacterium violaceum]
MVHALDVGGGVVPEAAGFEAMLGGARQRLTDDDQLLAEISQVLDSLYYPFHAYQRQAGHLRSRIMTASTLTPATYRLWQLTRYFLKLGALGFGGPVALVGYMHRDLVERRGWIAEADYKEGLALAQIAPGPLAAQLAIYLGYVHYRVLGATADCRLS